MLALVLVGALVACSSWLYNNYYDTATYRWNRMRRRFVELRSRGLRECEEGRGQGEKETDVPRPRAYPCSPSQLSFYCFSEELGLSLSTSSSHATAGASAETAEPALEPPHATEVRECHDGGCSVAQPARPRVSTMEVVAQEAAGVYDY